MHRLSLALGVAALALSSLAFTASGDTPAPTQAPEAVAPPTHTLSLTYQQTRGTFRRARLTLTPRERSAPPLWRGELASIVVVTKDGRWILIQSFRAQDGRVEARAQLPAPEAIAAILFKPRRGPAVGWKVNRDIRLSNYAETEWTVYSQEGEEEDPPKDPPEDPEDPDDGDEEGCTRPSCGGLIDPWTCECYPDMRDPWGSDVTSEEIVLSI